MAAAILALTAVAVYDAGEGDAGVGDTFNVGDFTYTILDGNGHVSVKMRSIASTTGNVAVPSIVTYGTTVYTVTEIAEDGFRDNTNITGITVPAALTKIGDHAFDGCTNLLSVNDYCTDEIASGYTALEYIQSSGTQYIDTGIITNLSNTYHIESSVLSSKNTRMIICGSFERSVESGGSISALNLELNGEKVRGYATATDSSGYLAIITSPLALNTIILTQLDWDASTKEFTVRGDDTSATGTYALADAVDGGQLRLFLDNRKDPKIIANGFRMYDCSIEVNSVLLRDFVPCIRQSDQAVGMYDTVTNTFFENSGTGSFTAGPVQARCGMYQESVISLSHVTTIGDYAFSGVSGMETVYLPEVTSIGKNAFSGFGDIEYITGTYVDLKQDIPAEYMQLEYIESSGTQYIDTGIVGSETDKVESTFLIKKWTRYGAIWTDYISETADVTRLILTEKNNGLAYVNSNSIAKSPITVDLAMNQWHIATVYHSGNTFGATVDGTTYSNGATPGSANTGSIYLFNSPSNLECPLIGKMSCWKAYSGSDLVSDLIPCIRLSDGAVGMYDRVSGDFLGNLGTGSFIPGPAVFSGAMYVPKVTSVGDYAFSGCGSLLTAKLDKVTSTGSHLFDGCTKLVFMGFDSLTDVGDGTFMGSGVEVVSTDGNYKASEYRPWSRLPLGYTELEYIQSTGTQYIDTGIILDGNTKVTVDYRYTALREKALFGSWNADPKQIWQVTSYNGKYYFGINSISEHSIGSVDLNRHTLVAEASDGTYSLTLDGTVLSSESDASATVSTLNCYLFGRNASSYGGIQCPMAGCIYSFSICQNGLLVADYVPCVRASDKSVGMYDLVTEKFFGSLGTGSFTAGPQVSTFPADVTVYLPSAKTIGASAFEGCTGLFEADLKNVTSIGASAFEGCTGISNITHLTSVLPAEYQEVEYIQSTGTQFINTGYAWKTQNVKYEVKFNPVSLTSGAVIGSSSSNSDSNWCVLYFTNASRYWAVGSGNPFPNLQVKAGNDYSVVMETDGVTKTATNSINGVTSTANWSGTFAPDMGNVCVMNMSNGIDKGSSSIWQYHGTLRVYYAKLTDDGTVVRDLIPCIHTIDGTVGMYDLVTKTFFGNAGTGSFEAGPRTSTGISVSAPSLRTIGVSAFEGCTGLEMVYLPDLTSMGASAFKGCTSLDTVDLSSLETVSDCAFKGCVNLNIADFEDTVSVGESAFEGCEAVERVGARIPSEYVEVEYIQFSGTQYIDTGTVPVQGDSFQFNALCPPSPSLTNRYAVIDSGGTGDAPYKTALLTATATEHFEAKAYYKYFAIGGATTIQQALDASTDVEITSTGALKYNGTQVGSSSYGGAVNTNLFIGYHISSGTCAPLTLKGEFLWKHEDGTLVRDLIPCIHLSDSAVGMYDLVTGQFFENSGTGDFIAGGKVLNALSFPSLLTMGDRAFAGCESLTSVNLPKVREISEGAFDGDKALVSIDMSRVTDIGSNAFKGCKSLESAVFSSDSCSLGNASFSEVGVDGSGLRLAAKVSFLGNGVFTGTNIKAIAEDKSSLVDGTISMHGLSNLPLYTFENLKYITIFQSQSLTNVGESAFENAAALTTVSIPSVTTVGKNAFANNAKLDRVTLGHTTNLLEAAFKGSGSAGFKVTGNIVSVGKDAFRSSKIQYIETDVPDTNHDVVLTYATGVQNGAFYGTPVRSVAMPALTSLGSDVFYQCEYLEKVTIGTGFKGEIPSNAFRSCSSLAEIHAVNATSIGRYAFYDCSWLTTVEFGTLAGETYTSSCTSVGEYAFCKCIRLDATYVAKNLDTISNYAFSETATTSYISVAQNATIGSGAFSKCSELSVVESNALSIGVNAFDMTGSGTKLVSVTMEYLTNMGVEAFKNCSSLGIVNIGTKGTSISGSAPKYLTEVPNNAFYGCQLLYTVNIPHVEKIGSYSFYMCPILTFGSVEDINTIESNIISIPHVTTIGDHAFHGDWNMEHVVAGNLVSLGASSFEGCSKLYTFRADAIESIGDRAFCSCPNLYHITDTKVVSASERSAYITKVESVGSEIFSGTQIENIYTGNISTVSASAFKNMTALKEAVIQGSVSSLSDGAFQGCTALTNVYLPASVTNIGKDVFTGTSGSVVVLCNSSVQPSGSTTGFVPKGTFTDSSIKWGYVIDMVGVGTSTCRIIDGAKYVLPYAADNEAASVVLYLKNGKTEAELNAGTSGSVISIYMYKNNESMTFRADHLEIGGFTVKATFSDLSAFEGKVEPTLNVTDYAQEFVLPVPKTEGSLKDENFTKYVGFDSSITFGNDTDPITQPFTVHMAFYESKFELFSNKSSYDLIQHYNVPPITSEMTGMPDTVTTTYPAGTETEYLDPAPEVAGYTYKGWYYDQLGTPGQEVVGNVVTMNKTQHIYAIYEPKTVVVEFKLGDTVLATAEAEQYVTLQVYNRGDPMAGRIVVSSVNGPDYPVYVYYSEEEYLRYFTPTVIGDGQDLRLYVINSKAYADSDDPGSVTIEKLYDNTVVEVQAQNRLYDIKVESYGVQCEAPALSDIKVSGNSVADGYWLKDLVYVQLDGITFPIQEVTAKGAAFHHAELYRGDTKLGSYGNIQGYTQSDIQIDSSTFGSYKSLTIKLYFEKSKYTLRYNMPEDFQGTYKADNSRSIGPAEDITLILPTPMGQSIAGYNFEGWYFNNNLLVKTIGETEGYLGTTGYLTEEMKAYGDVPEHTMIIDVYAKFSEKSYLVRYSYQAEDYDGKTQTYSRYAQTMGESGEPQYTLVKIGENIPYIVDDGQIPMAMTDLARDNKTLSGWYYSGTQPYITKLITAKVTSELVVSATSQFQGYNVITLTAVWEDKTYTIEFYPGYYDQEMQSHTQTAKVGETFKVPSSKSLKKEFHVFGYWYLGTTDTRFADGDEVKLTKAHTIYADDEDKITVEVFWKYDTYNIVYDSSIYQDAHGEVPPGTSSIQIGTKFYVAGTENPETGEPWLTRTGFTLIGWNYSKNPTVDPPKSPLTSYETMTEAMAATASTTDHNVHLYPVWSAQKYLIEYVDIDYKFGPYNPTMASYGSDVTISNPTKYGFTFAGWSADPTTISKENAVYSQGGNYISWDGSPTKATVFKNLSTSTTVPVKLSANWTRAEYTVKYDTNGATGAYAGGTQLICKVGEDLTLAELGDMTYTGRHFVGWTVNGVQTIGGSGETITVDDAMVGHADADKVLTIYALWDFNSYAIEYHYTDTGSSTVSTNYGVAVNIGIPVKDGYTFTGWKANVLGTTAMYSNDGNSWMPWPDTTLIPIGKYVINLLDDTGTVVLVAQWAKTEYTITYNPNGADGDPPEDTYPCTIGDPITLRGSGGLTKAGYTLSGWSLDKVNLIKSNVFTSAMAEKADAYRFVTVYAMWTPGTYTVKVSENETTVKEVLAYYDVSVDLGIPEREGYEFNGWSSTDVSIGNAMYSRNNESWFTWMNATDVIYAGYFKNLCGTVGGSVSMTANWTSVEYTVKYDANGGTGTVPEDSNVYKVDDQFALPSVEETKLVNGNKKLVGWALENDDKNALETTTFQNKFIDYADSNNVVTFYAVWAEGSYTVTVNVGNATVSEVPYGWTDIGGGKYTRPAEYGDSVKEIIDEWSDVIIKLDGCKFVKWSADRTKVVSDVTITAVFEEVSSTMIYYLCGLIAAIIVVIFVYTRIERR